MQKLPLTLVLGLAFAIYACGASEAVTENEEESVIDEAPAIVRAEQSPDQQLIDCIAANDKFAVEESQIVLTRSQSPETRDFALQAIEAHKQSTGELIKMAALVKMEIGPLVPAPSNHKKSLDSLRSLNMEQFDARYVADQITAHEKTLARLKEYTVQGESPTLKALAAAAIPRLANQIERARKLGDPTAVQAELLKQQSAT